MSTIDWSQIIGWKWDVYHVGIAAAILGRAYHAAGGWRGIVTRGGLVGIVKALLFGTNTPQPPKAP